MGVGDRRPNRILFPLLASEFTCTYVHMFILRYTFITEKQFLRSCFRSSITEAQRKARGKRITLSIFLVYMSSLRSPDSGWRDGSAVKSIACSSRGPEFNSQQPHGGSQPSEMRSDALFWPAGRHTDRIWYK